MKNNNFKYDVRCNCCGKFIKYDDISTGLASMVFIPDSDVSYEELLFHCRICTKTHGKPTTTQQFR